MEAVSERTGRNDVQNKPAGYAALGIQEYRRFGHTGSFHGKKLAGDRLVKGQYKPIGIEEVEEDVLQGHNTLLNLLVRWDHEQLRRCDPETGQEIPTFERERERSLAAEARVRELEAELERRQPDGQTHQNPGTTGQEQAAPEVTTKAQQATLETACYVLPLNSARDNVPRALQLAAEVLALDTGTEELLPAIEAELPGATSGIHHQGEARPWEFMPLMYQRQTPGQAEEARP